MRESTTHNLGLNYDTMEIKDAILTMCKPVIDEKSGEVFLYLIYRYVDKVGNRRELTIPRIKLPFRTDQIPFVCMDETLAPLSMREYYYYIQLCDRQLPICPFEGFSTSVDMTEVKDPCVIDRVIEYAVKEMTQEEIEQKLGYKVKIVTDKEENKMKDYLEKRNREATDILTAMRKLRDSEIESKGPHAELFTKVVSELSYRIATVPDEHGLCPNCETPIPKSEYDHYCGFCGQFIRK